MGLAVTIPLVITENYAQIWQAWVFPQNTTVLPLYIYYWWRRRNHLRRAVREWNRDVGAGQGVKLEFGVEDRVTNQRKFEDALTCGSCFCCKREAYIHIIRTITTENVV